MWGLHLGPGVSTLTLEEMPVTVLASDDGPIFSTVAKLVSAGGLRSRKKTPRGGARYVKGACNRYLPSSSGRRPDGAGTSGEPATGRSTMCAPSSLSAC